MTRYIASVDNFYVDFDRLNLMYLEPEYQLELIRDKFDDGLIKFLAPTYRTKAYVIISNYRQYHVGEEVIRAEARVEIAFDSCSDAIEHKMKYGKFFVDS